MTDKEKAIIMAHTGISMLEGEKFSIFHKYVEDICGRPIWTHELSDGSIWREIKEKSKDDFLRVCRSEDILDKVLVIIDSADASMHGTLFSGNVYVNRDMIRAAIEALRGEQE